ncbi:MAG: ribosome silencing factor [Chlorobi bacterium]|nr:ribosome silencing factor [Chlorobiota bacterium]
MARLCARCADEKKGSDIIAIDISEIDGAPAEWFIIVTCSSEQQIRAVAEYIEQETGRAGLQQPRSEGWESLRWVILDYFDVVVHLMRPEVRSFYKLESLWGDGRFYHLSADGRLIPVRSQS